MKIITCLVLSFFLMTTITVRADQKSERIRFERWRTSAVIKAAITNSEQAFCASSGTDVSGMPQRFSAFEA